MLVDLAGHLKVPTIFEGVEKQEQVDLVRQAGGQIIQGYYFSKPLPPEQFERLIEKDIREGSAC